MNSRAARLYGKNDLRVESFELPPLKSGELLLRVVVGAVCTSCHKVAALAENHHRVPADISQNPIVLGHEFTAIIEEVEPSLNDFYSVGESVVVQPMIYDESDATLAVGHSYPYLGGYATFVIVPAAIVQAGGVHIWNGTGAYRAALAEPLACIIAAWRTQYHTERTSYKPIHGTKPGGNTLLLAGAGTMGMLSALLWKNRADDQSTLTIVDRNSHKLIKLKKFLNDDPRISLIHVDSTSRESLLAKTAGEGFDDVVIFAGSTELVVFGLSLLAYDGCLNMFAGPKESDFSIPVDFHAVHYKRHHIVGSSGASGEDLRSALKLLANNTIDPSFLVTHVGGLNAVPDTVCNLPSLGGGKKMIYPDFDLPLTPISQFQNMAGYESVAEAIERFGGIWNEEAERRLIETISHRENDTTTKRKTK